MGRIFVSSDFHFCHNRDFIYKPRGFSSVWEMNEAIVKNWNEVVEPDDEAYILGDIMLHDNKTGLRLLKNLKGRLHIVVGNHDTDERIKLLRECWNVVEVEMAIRMRYNKQSIYMSHYPTIIGENRNFNRCVLNLYGHTHQKTNFFQDNPTMYHVGVDSRDCRPVLLDDAIEEIPTMYHVGVDSHDCRPVLLDDAIEEMRSAFEKKNRPVFDSRELDLLDGLPTI